MSSSCHAIVFLGPSLEPRVARELVDAEFFPPVKMGDVYAALARKPRIICVIDGLFERVPAVWHKEILFALSQGVRVVGASSMGALRAAELHAFGMEGVGGIFEAFRDGVLDADDEVTIVHGSADDGYRPLSEALVNLRDGLRLARSNGILDEDEERALVAHARATFYPERSWNATLAHCKTMGWDEARLGAFRELLAREQPNAKRRDAILALEHIAKTFERPAAPVAFDFEPTEFWHRLTSTTARRNEADASAAAVVDTARLYSDDFRALRYRALLSLLVASESDRSGLRIDPPQVKAAADRFRHQRGLASAERTRAWLAENGLVEGDLAKIARSEAACDELCARYGRLLDEAVVDELRQTGQYAELAAICARNVEARRGSELPAMEDLGIDAKSLLAWYRKRFRSMPGGLDAHARDRGFPDTAAFLREVLRVYCAETRASGAR